MAPDEELDPDTEPEEGDPLPPLEPEDPSENETDPFVQGG